MEPRRSDSWGARGSVLVEKARSRELLKACERALALDPDRPASPPTRIAVIRESVMDRA